MQHDVTVDPTTVRLVSVAEAARALGISSEAVRMRLRRKSIDGYRDDAGRWQVELAVAQRSTEPDQASDVTNGAAGGAAASGGSPVGEVADLRGERDRLLGMLEVALTERHDQPPTVLTSLRRLVATITDWLVERMRPGDAED